MVGDNSLKWRETCRAVFPEGAASLVRSISMALVKTSRHTPMSLGSRVCNPADTCLGPSLHLHCHSLELVGERHSHSPTVQALMTKKANTWECSRLLPIHLMFTNDPQAELLGLQQGKWEGVGAGSGAVGSWRNGFENISCRMPALDFPPRSSNVPMASAVLQ